MFETQEPPLRDLARNEPLLERSRLMTESVGPASPNGIKLVRVFIEIDPITNKPKDEARLDVYFYNPNYLTGANSVATVTKPKDIFMISGGTRVRGGKAAGQVQVDSITPAADPNVLSLVVKPVGDYSTYTLTLVTPLGKNWTFDPLFSEIRFKFRPACFNNNCSPDWAVAPPPFDEPVIDYLAKDYGSFRQTMINAMSARVPEWQPTSEADLDMVLADLFSVAADELSDYQDRVMNEAFFARARKRVSVARHARLMDYHIHQGSQASTWLALEIEHDTGTKSFELKDYLHIWAGQRDAIGDDTGQTVDFLSKYDGTQTVHQYLNNIGLYTWSDTITTLKAGSTRADLRLYRKLYLGDPSTPSAITTKTAAVEIRDLVRNSKIRYLVIQEHLNPKTGLRAGRNPAKRQLLKLIPDKAEALEDNITGEWFVRVRWEKTDELRYDYCFTVDCPGSGSGTAAGKIENVSMFHGNLVEVFHGREQTNLFVDRNDDANNIKEPLDPDRLKFYYEQTRWGTICHLPEVPLAYTQTTPGGDVAPISTLKVNVELPSGLNHDWNERPNLIHSDDGAESGDHFVVETDENRRSIIRFGNGANGRELPENAVVTCTYQHGLPLDGNVGAERITSFEQSSVNANAPMILRSCWNPFDVTNGIDREPVYEIVRRVPEAYRYRQLRAVSLADYVARAEEIDGVSRAAASYAWTGSWRTVRVTIDPEGTNELSFQLREAVSNYLNAIRLIGEDLEIRPPHFIPLDINVILCAAPDFWPEDIQSVLEQEFSAGWTPDGRRGFFHPDEWTFGQPLYASQIIGRALQVSGVEHAVEQKTGVVPSDKTISVSIKRWNSAHAPTESITNIAPNEIIQVMSDPDHLELGTIGFLVKGGRQ